MVSWKGDILLLTFIYFCHIIPPSFSLSLKLLLGPCARTRRQGYENNPRTSGKRDMQTSDHRLNWYFGRMLPLLDTLGR